MTVAKPAAEAVAVVAAEEAAAAGAYLHHDPKAFIVQPDMQPRGFGSRFNTFTLLHAFPAVWDAEL